MRVICSLVSKIDHNFGFGRVDKAMTVQCTCVNPSGRRERFRFRNKRVAKFWLKRMNILLDCMIAIDENWCGGGELDDVVRFLGEWNLMADHAIRSHGADGVAADVLEVPEDGREFLVRHGRASI